MAPTEPAPTADNTIKMEKKETPYGKQFVARKSFLHTLTLTQFIYQQRKMISKKNEQSDAK